MTDKSNLASVTDGGPKTFSDEDIRRAESWLESTAKRPIISAIRFRNSLQALLRGVERTQNVIPPLAIMAVDTTEIAPLIRYDDIHLRNFSFQGLLEEKPNGIAGQNLRTLDRLIIQHLLRGRSQPFLLLNPHAEEVEIIRHATVKDSASWQAVRETAYAALSVNQRKNIKKLFTDVLTRHEHGAGGELATQWSAFKKEALSDLSDRLLSTLLKNTAESKGFDAFIKNANFMYVRPASAGPRLLVRYLESAGVGGFVWDDYEAYANSPKALTRGKKIFKEVRNILAWLRSGYKDATILNAAINRDALAFVIIDSINGYFIDRKIDARVDFVGRSPSLHDVIAALPEGALHVTLRHPLFLPDIYNFDRAQLNHLGEALQRLDATLASAIDIDALSVDEPSDPAEEDELLEQVKAIAQDVLEVLADAVVVRQALESQVLDDALGSPDAPGDDLAQLVRRFFEAVEDGGRAGEDLLSRSQFHQLVDRNRALADYARPRVFGDSPDERLEIRLIDFFPESQHDPDNTPQDAPQPPHPVDGFAPDAMMMIRATRGGFRRIFHIHSKNIACLIRQNIVGGAARKGPEEQRTGHRPGSYRGTLPLSRQGTGDAVGCRSPAKSAEQPHRLQPRRHFGRVHRLRRSGSLRHGHRPGLHRLAHHHFGYPLGNGSGGWGGKFEADACLSRALPLSALLRAGSGASRLFLRGAPLHRQQGVGCEEPGAGPARSGFCHPDVGGRRTLSAEHLQDGQTARAGRRAGLARRAPEAGTPRWLD